ncbi:hypothetical protein [Arthrobacter sp. zg-Y895]|uniref:hypothetical protein n=1 Tax=Arthrobacter sp. zg-Y895 TaxID=2886933 RepID=UPI001D13EAFD|nr:hypothetical protein [Arthrobacter sp. zg-Y895]MCC3301585.1 hypothetical protein [Arthrobacter sp. zg-Y895]
MTTLINRNAAPATTENAAPRPAATGSTVAPAASQPAPATQPRRLGTYTTCYGRPLGTPRAEGTYVSTGRRALTRPRNLGSYVDTAAHLNRRPQGSYTLRG